MQRQEMRLELTPKMDITMSPGIAPDSGVNLEKIAKSLVKKIDKGENLLAFLTEKFSLMTAGHTRLDMISRDPALRANLLSEVSAL
jgi:hypothetical protein